MGAWIGSPIRKLRTRITRVNDTVYLAATDGVVNATAFNVDSTGGIYGYSDGSNPPTTILTADEPAHTGVLSDIGIEMTVKKGDYWKVTGAQNVYWVPEN